MAAQVMAGFGTKGLKKLRPAGEGRKVKRGTSENDQILTAAQRGDIDTLVSMSHRGIDITTARSSSSDGLGDTVLHEACCYGRSYTVACILSTGIPVDVRNDLQYTALHYAAIYNEVDCIKLLCDAGATVDAKNENGRTPLHRAADRGNSEALYMLLVAGATVDVMDKDGYTPLADAVHNGHGDIVNILIKHKADPTKVPQWLQQRLEKLLRKEEEKTRVSADKDTNVGSSSHDPQQAQNDSKGKQKNLINRRTVLAYRQALKNGKRKSNKFKIVLVGAEGAGKSSTAHSLLGKKFQPQQPTTVGAAVNTCTADQFFATKWKQIELEHQLEQLPKQFKHELKVCMSQLPTEKPASGEYFKEEKVACTIQSEKQAQPEYHPEEKIPDELVTKVQEVVDTKEIHDGDVQIIILDLGGQEVYYHVHFLFLAQEDVVFLTFDASKDLDQPVICRQRLTRFQQKVKTRGMQTNIQTIEILMQSVYSHCGKAVEGKIYISNRIPTIILVATHCKGLSPQQKNSIITKIYQKFAGRPFMDHLPRSRQEAIFFVDNSDRDPEVFTALQVAALKAAAPTIAEECPISYLQFEVEILKQSQSRAVISKQEASAIAEKADLQGDLMEVLNHYTLKGTLLYYPEVESLQNEVFVSPQEVSDMVSSVISTHNCEPTSASLQLACDRYDSFGLLEENLLDDMLKSVDRYKDKSIVLGFLEKFHLAVEVSRDTKFAEEEESYETPKTGRVLLVPSMLVYNPEEVPDKSKGNIILVYYFPDKFVPENFFNQVLVNMVSWCKLQGHHVHSIFHGVGHFQFKGRTQSFKLQRCSQASSIKCYIIIHRHNLADNVLDAMLQQRRHLRDHIEDCINEAHQSHISCARPPVGYLECPLHESQQSCPPHIRLDELTPSGDVTCPKSIDCQVVSREAYALLFVKSLKIPEQSRETECSKNEMITTGSMLSQKATGSVRKPVDGAVVFSQIQNKDDVPSMRDLNRYVVHKCASEWEDIAFELGLDDKQVEIIKKDNRECKDCLRRTLQKWLDSSTPPATWKTLEVAITNAKRAQLFLDPVCDVYASEERGVKRRISSIQSGSSDEQATKTSKT